MTRTRIHRARTPLGSDTVFLTDDGIDLDQSVNYEVVRRRVFFDDVQLVTLHRERGVAFVILTGGFGLLWTMIAIFMVALAFEAWPAALPFFAIGAPALAACLLRLAIGREVVTVFGRRSRAVLRFGMFRKARARAVYGQICAAVRRAQSREMPAAPTPAESGVPLPPPDVPLPPPAQ